MKKKYGLFMLIVLFLTGCGSIYEISESTKQQATKMEINLDEQTLDEVNQLIFDESH